MQHPTVTPPVLWAQRNDRLLLTINVQDVRDPKIKLTEKSLVFSGSTNAKEYKVELEFFGDINAEASKWGVLPRHIQLNIVKKESGPYWERLLKESGKHWFLQVDWDRWVDEDEQDEAGKENDFNLGDLDMGGGEDFEDDEDDDMPELEEDQPSGETASPAGQAPVEQTPSTETK